MHAQMKSLTALSSAVVISLAGSAFGVAYAQDSKVELEQRPLPPLPTSISGTETVRARIQAWLRKHPDGLSHGEGKTSDGRTYIVSQGVAAISVKPADPAWVDARANAFAKSLLRAKGECARFQESRILSEMSLAYKEPSPERARADAQRMQREGLVAEGAVRIAQAMHNSAKAMDSPVLQTAALYAEKIVTNKFNEALVRRGIDPTKPVDEQKIKEVQSTESFKQTVRVAARAKCTGVKALAAFEQTPADATGEVGVIAIWTERLHQIADAMATGNFSLLPVGQTGLPVAQHTQIDPRTLLTTFGPMIVRDETGQYVLLAFAQAQPRTRNPQSIQGAYMKARTLADGMVRQFVGETVSLEDDLKKRDESTDFGDLDVVYKNDDSFEQKISAVAPRLNLRGIQEAHSWETLHPANQAPVVGVVVQWKPSAVRAASQVKAIHDAPPGSSQRTPTLQPGSQGAPGAGPAGAVPGSGRPAPPTQPYQGQGRSSRDF